MGRKQIYIDEATVNRLVALTNDQLCRPLYASESEAIRVAVERLFNHHFHPTSEAADAVLEQVRAQLRAAIGVVDGELMRRDGN